MALACASVHRSSGCWPKHEAAGTVTLYFEERHRRRIRLVTDQGEEILLDLPSAVAMADGDGLRLNDGRWLQVQAAAEPVVEVSHRDPEQLTRLAWHLGNRHLPTQIGRAILRIRPDHVIEGMLEGLGANLVKVRAPFQPEGGAYGNHGERHHVSLEASGHRHEP
ncbi:MAG TPA: urease accessory protein UreE [Steroidobacteraceae bacterium]|jgi:urease accessory protein|nr:urease accessory protein UreE [Steroidobacteraceae bacterium]